MASGATPSTHLQVVRIFYLPCFSLHGGVIFLTTNGSSPWGQEWESWWLQVYIFKACNPRERDLFSISISPEKTGQAWVMCQPVRLMTVTKKISCCDQLMSCTIVGYFPQEGSTNMASKEIIEGGHPNYKTLLKLPDNDLWWLLGRTLKLTHVTHNRAWHTIGTQ